MDIIKELMRFIEPGYLVLIPVLMGIGYAIKSTRRIKDEDIPIALMVIGIVLAIAVGLVAKAPIIEAVMQGVISATASTWIYEAIHQQKKKPVGDEDELPTLKESTEKIESLDETMDCIDKRVDKTKNCINEKVNVDDDKEDIL